MTFEPAVTDRFLIITSPEVETEQPPLLEQDRAGFLGGGGTTGGPKCSSSSSSLSHLDDCFKYLPL